MNNKILKGKRRKGQNKKKENEGNIKIREGTKRKGK